MKLRTILATTAVAAIGASSLLIPTVDAATVEFEGNYCKITFTNQDLTEMRNDVLNTDPGAVQRVKEAFPGLDEELDILLNVVEAQILENLSVDSTLFSPEEQQALNRYLAAGNSQGYTQDDLILILVSPAIPNLLGTYFEEEGESLIGSFTMTKSQARQQVLEIDYYLRASGFDPASGKFLGLQVSPKASAIVSPALDTMTVFADQVKQPFQDCVDGNGDTGGGDGNGDGNGGGGTDNGSGTPGGNPGGNGGAGSGGSSFGSS